MGRLDEVREAFLAACSVGGEAATSACFQPAPNRAGHFFADLYALARPRGAHGDHGRGGGMRHGPGHSASRRARSASAAM